MPDDRPAEEFFYLDNAGDKQDAALHNAIINPVDFPIDEKIMAPIREKYRAEYLAALKVEHDAARRKSQWASTKARSQMLLAKGDFIQDPATGRFEGSHPGPGHGEGGGADHAVGSPSPHAKDPKSASALLRLHPNVTEDQLVEKSGAAQEIRTVEAKIAAGHATDRLVGEGGFKTKEGPGNWTKQREAEHYRIERDILSPKAILDARPAPGEQPTLYLLGGRGGSGKSWLTENPKGPLYGNKALVLNNDHVKEKLPGWKGWDAALKHGESSEVGKSLEKSAREMGLNVIIDGTLADAASTEKRINDFKAAGYRIEGYYMYASPKTATERALGRFMKGQQENGMGRYVPPKITLSSTSNEHNFDTNRPKMDHWEVYNNDDPSFKPTLHSKKD
jgi:predicted ABC-type ATPase